MSLVLAEIADKMPTVIGMWVFHLSLCVLLVLIVSRNRWTAVGAGLCAFIALAFLTYGSFSEAFWEGSHSDDVWNELGGKWVAHSFLSRTVPYLVVVALAPFAWRKAIRSSRSKRGLCEKCAYPIGVNSVCTECGAAVARKVEA